MSNGARIGLLVATVAALVLAFVLLAPGDDAPDTETVPTASATATTPASPADDRAQTTAVTPPSAFETIRVRNGKPVGGVQTITVQKGDRVRIQVSSPDTSDEIHLHGYDIAHDLKAGGRVRFSFDAKAEGIFEVELERAGVKVGRLVVEP